MRRFEDCPCPRHADAAYPTPGEAACRRLWDEFDMPEHIRRHSELTAMVAVCLAERGVRVGLNVTVEVVRAAALLHDLAKPYTIEHGGNHAQLGGVWVLDRIGNPVVAHGVTHHAHWPWRVDAERCPGSLIVMYADKRVMHDRFATLAERYDDLVERYGRGRRDVIAGLDYSRRRAEEVERVLGRRLEIDLNACAFNGGRLVE